MKFLYLALVIALLNVSSVFSIDVPEGADAIFHQMRNSNVVALATLKSMDKTKFTFVIQKNLLAQTGKEIVVSRFSLENSHGISIKENTNYLLFLKQKRLTGGILIGYSFAMGGYSLQPVGERDFNGISDVVADYVRFKGDKASLKAALLNHNLKANGYVQYSTVVDLDTHGMMDATVAETLAERVKSGKLTDPRAKFTIVNRIQHFGLKKFAPILESMILNTNENISVRTASLKGLQKFGDQAALARVAPVLVEGMSGRLRRTTIDIVNPR